MVQWVKRKERGQISKKKRRTYSLEFKANVGLEALKDENTLAQLSADFDVPSQNIRNWKNEILANASQLFCRRQDEKKAEEELQAKDWRIDQLYKEVGQLTVQVNGAKKKLSSLDSLTTRSLVEKDSQELDVIVLVKGLRKKHFLLFTTDLRLTDEQMLEYYAARFQIEITFRELKQDLGALITAYGLNLALDAIFRSHLLLMRW